MKNIYLKIITLFCFIILLGIFNACGGRTKNVMVTDYDSRPIVCFGDSLTYGQGASSGQTYPDFLQKKVKDPVINADRNGHTSEDGLSGFVPPQMNKFLGKIFDT